MGNNFISDAAEDSRVGVLGGEGAEERELKMKANCEGTVSLSDYGAGESKCVSLWRGRVKLRLC